MSSGSSSRNSADSPRSCSISSTPQPLSTASIGQVHVAICAGAEVAVKVQRPSVDADFTGDIRLMIDRDARHSRLRIKSLYWVLEPMDEFVVVDREELDYRREARYAERLRRNADDNPFERVPAVFWDLTTRRTLVMEFMSGDTVLAYLRAMESGDELTTYRLRAAASIRIASLATSSTTSSATCSGTACSTPICIPPICWCCPANVVGYVDFGITGVLSRYSRRHLVALTLAYTRADVSEHGGRCSSSW